MPVRIYDIAKRVGLESKQVLAKAKELGITAAKVPSSTLDKITAEYLEIELGGAKPPPLPEPPPAPPPPPIVVVSAPPEAPPQAPPALAPTPEVKVEAPALEALAPAPVVASPPAVEAPPAPVPEAEPATPEVSEPKQEVAPTVPPPVAPEPPKPVEPAVVAPPPPPPPPPAPPVPPPPPPPPPAPKVGDKIGFIQLPTRPRAGDKPGPDKSPPGRPGAPERGRGDGRGGRPAAAPGRAAGAGARQDAGRAPAEPKFVAPESGEVITIKPPIVVRELAERLKQKPVKIIGDLMELRVFANVNQSIDATIAQRICAKYGFRFEVEKRAKGEGQVHTPVRKTELDAEDKVEDLKPRAPVVTIMGHVDHGKTTLLDGIRKSNVAAGEAGGITQHIGAYTISFPHPERKKELAQITFLDTPGHAAFSAMRARGANVTDIVVLVVAANDGVMPQTMEALSHAKAAKVPILVAVNKCDHPNANPLRVRQQLQDKGLVPDDWGGDTIFVDVSALTKQGVDKLIEMLLLQADLLELKANPTRRAKGNVIESGLEPGGPTATVLVRKGTLRVGDMVICSQFYGKVRALISEDGKRQKEAGPSVAVKLLGLNGVPEAGLEFSVVESDKDARAMAEQRAMEARALGQEKESRRAKVTLEELLSKTDSSGAKTLKLVVKADTQGSVEAIVEALKKIESEKVDLDIIHSAVGTITDSDVSLAAASNAVILGFHTRIDAGVSDTAKHEGVQIKLYAIIYELIDEVKAAMAGLLEPIESIVTTGSAEVRQIFQLSKGVPVAGCMVHSGRIVRGKVRVVRRKNLIYEGVTQSLRRFQDEVNEVRAGLECGIRVEGFGEFQVGDTIECYAIERKAQEL